jgi:hypothetical protein
MVKYYKEDYYSVVDKRSGRKIADCGTEEDALVLVGFDLVNRVVVRNHLLMGQVVDVVPQKTLPTSAVVVGEKQCDRVGIGFEEDCKRLEQGVGKPVVV